jgi:hypothetical protein
MRERSVYNLNVRLVEPTAVAMNSSMLDCVISQKIKIVTILIYFQ